MSPGIWQIAIVVLLVLVVFGAGKLPRIMGDLAEGIKSFKKGIKDEEASEDKTTKK
jgi:sec-independent protein translocase protein TatA